MTSAAASNVRWVGVTQAGRIGVQVASLIVLSRLLPPADFGLMAMAAVVMNFANLFRDMGTSVALIQRQELTKELLDTVFWLNVAFGILLGACIAIAAPAAAWAFSAGTLTGVMLGLAVVFPVASTSAPHLALLERAGVDWCDSCASADHPMIDHFWRERRAIGRVSVGIGGKLRRAAFRAIARVETRARSAGSKGNER